MSDMYCVVALDDGSRNGLAERVKAHFGNHVILSEDTALIISGESAEGVATILGVVPIDEGDQPELGTGVVFRLNGSYSGYGRAEVANWLREMSTL